MFGNCEFSKPMILQESVIKKGKRGPNDLYGDTSIDSYCHSVIVLNLLISITFFNFIYRYL